MSSPSVAEFHLISSFELINIDNGSLPILYYLVDRLRGRNTFINKSIKGGIRGKKGPFRGDKDTTTSLVSIIGTDRARQMDLFVDRHYRSSDIHTLWSQAHTLSATILLPPAQGGQAQTQTQTQGSASQEASIPS